MGSTVLSRVKKACLKRSGEPAMRRRLIDQLALLSKTGYFKRKFKVPSSAVKTEKSFKTFFNKMVARGKFAKNAELLVLHSLVVSILIAEGDGRSVRQKVGKALQSKLKLPNLAKGFDLFPNFYARFLAFLPPVSSDGVKLTSVLMRAL